jgi:hypothetical protein
MADPPVRASAAPAPPLDEDQAEQAVLGLLLDVYPVQLSLEELLREMTDRPDEFGPRDRVNNAVRDLVAAGLVHRHGQFVFATRAAARFDALKF